MTSFKQIGPVDLARDILQTCLIARPQSRHPDTHAPPTTTSRPRVGTRPIVTAIPAGPHATCDERGLRCRHDCHARHGSPRQGIGERRSDNRSIRRGALQSSLRVSIEVDGTGRQDVALHQRRASPYFLRGSVEVSSRTSAVGNLCITHQICGWTAPSVSNRHAGCARQRGWHARQVKAAPRHLPEPPRQGNKEPTSSRSSVEARQRRPHPFIGEER